VCPQGKGTSSCIAFHPGAFCVVKARSYAVWRAHAHSKTRVLHILTDPPTHCPARSKGARLLAEWLRAPRCAAQALFLDGNGIGPEGARLLAAALPANGSLSVLDLSRNALGAAGAAALAAALVVTQDQGQQGQGRGADGGGGSGCALRDLRLCGNELGAEGAAAVAALLLQRPLPAAGASGRAALGGCSGSAGGPSGRSLLLRLRALDVRENGIGCAGACAVARALAGNTSLTALDGVLFRDPPPDAGW
jgi:hypothetical protein